MLIFQSNLIEWYQKNQRDLPWRSDKNPYHIWLSEVILQQTRVDQGMDYYYRFVERWPDIFSLATDDEQNVLKMWQGLGYYSRARNLLKCAIQIVEQYNGVFPDEIEKLKKLSGIGDYTAAAIVSIAYNKPYAVVDGNVYRVLSRLFEIDTPINSTKGKKQFAALAQEILFEANPGIFNQAMMEFGALQCVPNKPNCAVCPLRELCLAFKNKTVANFPVKTRNIKIRERHFNYILFILEQNDEHYTYIHKRETNDIWKNLYDFFLIETEKTVTVEALLHQKEFVNLLKNNPFELLNVSTIYTHKLSHQTLKTQFLVVRIKKKIVFTSINKLSLIKISELGKFPLPRLLEKYLNENNTMYH
ncbi:MAG: A/G-specific adenine glycosylase [Lentimicrobiaceae bacterium]|jgi:A/G-specific adenine glycosylase|nr:A/G-specific adenine glycosylase [Lentimicrobiaceae bacterium]